MILFVFGGLVFLLGKGMEKTVLEKSFYEDIVEETDLSPILVDGFVNGMEQQWDSSTVDLPAEEQERIAGILEDSVSEAVSEEWTEETAILVIGDFLSYFKGEQEELTAVVDLRERKEIIKNNLETEFGEVVDAEIDRQIQERDIPASMEDQVRSQVRSEIESNMGMTDSLLENIPDEVAVAETLKAQNNLEPIEEARAEFQQSYSFFTGYFHWILILLAIVILAVAGVGRGLQWIGIGMLVSGASLFLFLLVLKNSFASAIKDLNMGLEIDKFNVFLDPFFSQMNSYVLAYVIAGVVALIGGILLKKYRQDRS